MNLNKFLITTLLSLILFSIYIIQKKSTNHPSYDVDQEDLSSVTDIRKIKIIASAIKKTTTSQESHQQTLSNLNQNEKIVILNESIDQLFSPHADTDSSNAMNILMEGRPQSIDLTIQKYRDLNQQEYLALKLQVADIVRVLCRGQINENCSHLFYQEAFDLNLNESLRLNALLAFFELGGIDKKEKIKFIDRFKSSFNNDALNSVVSGLEASLQDQPAPSETDDQRSQQDNHSQHEGDELDQLENEL